MSNVFDQFDPAPVQRPPVGNVFDQFDAHEGRPSFRTMPMAQRDGPAPDVVPFHDPSEIGPEPAHDPASTALERIAGAAKEGFGRPALTPQAEAGLQRHGLGFLGPVAEAASVPLRLPGALFRGAQQTAVEAGVPSEIAGMPEAFMGEVPGMADYGRMAAATRSAARAHADRTPSIVPNPNPEPPSPAMQQLEHIANPQAPPEPPAAAPPSPAPEPPPQAPSPAPAPPDISKPVVPPAEPPPANVSRETPQPTDTEKSFGAAYTMMKPSDLTLAPGEYQYKTANEKGETGALEGVKQWNPNLADIVTGYQRDDGKTYVVNGHQRTNLAQRAEAAGQQDIQIPTRVFREADGYTPEFMRTLGAYQNIAQGNGSSLDAARVLRGAGSLPPGTDLPELPPKSQLVRDAAGLAQLTPEAFGAVENGVVAPEHAARVGELIHDQTEQAAAMDMLARAQPANTNQARLMVQDIRNSGFLKGSQTTLFGDEDFARSLVPERAKVLDNSLRSLRRTGTVFRAAVEGEDTLAGAGNALNREGNVAARTENAGILDRLQRDATTRGPISDALTAAAGDLAGGKPIAGVTSRFLTAVRKIERSGQAAGVPDGDLSGSTGPAPEDGHGLTLTAPTESVGRTAPEPTIHNDPTQQVMPGMAASAVQAQAARDQAGRGALLSQTEQKPANEGLFAKPEAPQPGLKLYSGPTALFDPDVWRAAFGRKANAPQNPEMPPDSLWGGNQPPPKPPATKPELSASRIIARQTKNLNPIEQLATFPRTVASLDDMSAHFWNAWQGREQQASTNADALRQIIAPTFTKLDKAGRRNVASALEIGRIQGAPIADAAGNIVVRNTSIPHARWSKVGDAVTLSPDQTRAYQEAVQLGQAQWTMLMRATAKRYGWEGDLNPALIRVASGGEEAPKSKAMSRLADLIDAMKSQQHDIYFPMSRFGSHYISVHPNSGDAVMSRSGMRPTEWFETIDKPPLQDVLGVSSGRFSVEAAAVKRIAELRQQFPPDRFDIEHGDFSRKPSLLRRLDIPAIEKLMMLMEQGAQKRIRDQVMSEEGGPATKQGIRDEAKRRYEAMHGEAIQAFEDQLFEELKAGYRRKAKVTPGYSDDFDRAIGTHLHQIARNSADMLNRDAIESAYTQIQDYHPHRNVANYWRDWRDYQERPDGVLTQAANGLNQIGFAYVLGMNPSSTIIMASHTPLAAAPVLSVGVGPGVAGAALTRGLGAAYRALSFDSKHGASISIDKAIAAMPPAKQAFIRKMETEGRLGALGAQDLGRLNERQSALWGEHAGMVRRGLDIATSNVHAVDQANRVGIASAAWDIASDPAKLNAAATPLMQHNALFRNMVERDGLSPETFGRFMLSQAAFEWGKQSRAPIQRGPLGTMAFALHGFQTRYLSTALGLMKNMGPSGRMAGLFMMGALALGAGLMGLPFTQDAENATNAVWRHFSGKNLGQLRDAMGDSGFAGVGSKLMLDGPLSTMLGIDLGSRIGFGDVVSRELDGASVLGSYPSILWNAMQGVGERAHAGQSAAAVASEAAPFALRGPLRAAAASQQGIMSRSGGTQYMQPGQVAGTDLARLAAGFTPLSVRDARAERERFYQAKQGLPAIRDEIKAGNTDQAVQDLVKLGMTRNQIRMIVRETMRGRSDRWFQRFEERRQAP